MDPLSATGPDVGVEGGKPAAVAGVELVSLAFEPRTLPREAIDPPLATGGGPPAGRC